MSRLRSLDFLARAGIVVQFLALIRCLGEYYRLKYLAGGAFEPLGAEPFIFGALVAAIFCLTSVLLYFAGRLRWVLAATGSMVVTLMVVKFTLIGG
jgi:hypothetical protein